ncbi:DUF2304 domain-containing protein [Pseudarthrobacter sp. NamE5]|uniref:DUF2304 domain-containing protein n=1 Tax=Pseudarthrobacter sp. NamE5 TaxID=2576839 RepID=UPI00110AE1B0|nr:DUF2304 domain-containing protein [Pseudarthrobacter sp. NamE5]TLM86789.1 DUF2304 domain-containing protein [Pseudarthrobacter sp. NamE5]
MSVAFSLVTSIGMVLAVLLMLRVGKLREKYAVLWLVVGGLTIVLGIFPNLLDFAASAVGVRVPSNLLFALSIVLLVGVGLHVSRELTILEDETRILAEEVAILRSSVARLSLGESARDHGHVATETVDQTSNSREERN